MMRDDLECEIRDLSQDIVRRSIGMGNNHENIPPKVIYNFLVMRKYYQQGYDGSDGYFQQSKKRDYYSL